MKTILLLSLGLMSSLAFAGPDVPVISVGHEQTTLQEEKANVLTTTARELGSVKVDILGFNLDFGTQGQPLSQIVETLSRDVDALDGAFKPGTHLNHKPWEALSLVVSTHSESMSQYKGQALPLKLNDTVTFHYAYHIVDDRVAVYRFATDTVECESRVIPFLRVQVEEPTGVLQGVEFLGEARNISSKTGEAQVQVHNRNREAAVAACFKQLQ